MAIEGQMLGALLLVSGGRVDLRRSLWRPRARPAPRPRPARPAREDRRAEQKPIRQRPDSRTCGQCHEPKPLDAFVPIKASKNGYCGRCRACRNERARARYESSPQIRAVEIERAERNKQRRAAPRLMSKSDVSISGMVNAVKT